MIVLKVIYVANVVVAGWISVTSIFAPNTAVASVFTNAYPSSEYIRLVGCLWLGIAVLSVFGLYKPIAFSPVLILQLIYKGIWLLVVALPALLHHRPFPQTMAIFFIVWVVALPFIIPWKTLFQ